MRRNPLVLAWLVFGVVCFFSQSWAQCPEDPNDNGVCDTLYVEIWPGDDSPGSFPHYARFPIRVTSDIPDASIDSVAGFMIPLCFTSTNPSANAIIDPAKNKCGVQDLGRLYHPGVFDLNNSIFRDLPSMEDPQELNWMMDLSDEFGPEWDTRILNLSTGSNFWLSLVASGSMDRRFKGGSRVLLATATFTIEDTTTICIDSCFWPPTGRLIFSRSDAAVYIPRHFLPVCEDLSLPCPMAPYFTDGVADQYHTANGHYVTDDFVAVDYVCGPIEQVGSYFDGEGVDNVTVIVDHWWWMEVVGHVEYDVTDSCGSGGYVVVYAINEDGGTGQDYFTISLRGNAPHLALADTWRALAGYTMGLQVSADDPDGDSVAIQLEGFWYEPDSLQSPTNSPFWDGGNPGLFTWTPTEADTGNWICSFSATDVCGDVTTHLLSIRVGMPFCGDCTGDGEINLADVVYLIADLFKDGPPPDPLCMGDGNCSGVRDVGDVVVLINYLFKYGQAPCFECCP